MTKTLTNEELKCMHTLARDLWKRDQLQLPARDRYDGGSEDLLGKLRYQAEAKRMILSERA